MNDVVLKIYEKEKNNNQIIIYNTKSGAIELQGDFNKETVWATQAQIADVFNIDRSVVTKHIGNVLKIKEVDEKSNVQKCTLQIQTSWCHFILWILF